MIYMADIKWFILKPFVGLIDALITKRVVMFYDKLVEDGIIPAPIPSSSEEDIVSSSQATPPHVLRRSPPQG